MNAYGKLCQISNQIETTNVDSIINWFSPCCYLRKRFEKLILLSFFHKDDKVCAFYFSKKMNNDAGIERGNKVLIYPRWLAAAASCLAHWATVKLKCQNKKF